MSRSVLIVDDSITASRQLATIINGFGNYEVVGNARDGAEALKRYQELEPDIVVLDIVMPNMDGLACLRGLTQIDENVRVVMISSMGGVGRTVEEALKLGARAVITKPFESLRVQAILDKAYEEG